MRLFTAHLLALLGCLALATDINIDLSSTAASVQANSTIVLQFYAYGGRSPYSFSYLGIPQDWSSQGNDLVIRNYNPNINQGWTFDILVRDSFGSSLLQTVKL